MSFHPALDAWRGIAVLWVLLYHLDLAYALHFWDAGHRVHLATGIPLEDWAARLPALGFLGVDLFFVLSGFLITGLLWPEVEGGLRAGRFWARRFFKIVPHYAAALGAGLALTYVWPAPPAYLKADASIGSYFVFLQNYAVPVPVLSHFWSLAVEEHFYLAYPVLMLALASVWRATGRAVPLRALAAGTLAALVVIFALARRADPGAGGLAFRTHVRLDALLFGCLVRLAAGSFRGAARPALLALGVILLGRFFAYGFDPARWFHYSEAYVAFGALLAATYDHPAPHTAILRRIGGWSYGIYLWHPHVILLFGLLPHTRPAALACAVASIAAGGLATGTIEAWALSSRKRLVP